MPQKRREVLPHQTLVVYDDPLESRSIRKNYLLSRSNGNPRRARFAALRDWTTALRIFDFLCNSQVGVAPAGEAARRYRWQWSRNFRSHASSGARMSDFAQQFLEETQNII